MMELFYSSSSPFARKARVVAREKGIEGRLQEIECNPFANPPALLAVNPLGRIPALVTADGVLYDSPVICDYFDHLGDPPWLTPTAGPERWRIMRAHALADGIMDLAVALTLEGRRSDSEQSPAFRERCQGQIRAALDAMQEEVADLPATLSMGSIAFVIALDYLDFRHVNLAWRNGRDRLSAWRDEAENRPSLAATRPSDASSAR